MAKSISMIEAITRNGREKTLPEPEGHIGRKKGTMHTKGKWEVSKHATPDYAPQYGIHKGGTNDFCIVKDKEAEANAHLIAAAPDLLEACKEINKRIDFLLKKILANESYPYKIILERIEIDKTYACMSYINEAITKAEGGELC